MTITLDYFENKFEKSPKDSNILLLKSDDAYVSNFSKQWKVYRDTQIDSINNFKLSYKYLNEMFFFNLDLIKNKNILEIGSGAGRFSEYFANLCNEVVSIDLSDSIYYNIVNKKNFTKIKGNYLDLIPKKKFDVVFCRGVLQHTPEPLTYISKLFQFLKKDGIVSFDIYKKPKANFFHPKYLYWRIIFQKFVKYENCERFLNKHIREILLIRRVFKAILFNSNFLADYFIPVYDYKNQYKELNNKQIEKWAILDTLDGFYAKYDKPYSNNQICNYLKKKNLKIIKNNTNKNIFLVSF